MFVFREIWRALFSCNTRSEIRLLRNYHRFPALVLVKRFDKSHHLCILHIFGYYFVMPYLRFERAKVSRFCNLNNLISHGKV